MYVPLHVIWTCKGTKRFALVLNVYFCFVVLQVLREIEYSNKKPAYYLNRVFKLTCSELNGRFTSNEYVQTVSCSFTYFVDILRLIRLEGPKLLFRPRFFHKYWSYIILNFLTVDLIRMSSLCALI